MQRDWDVPPGNVVRIRTIGATGDQAGDCSCAAWLIHVFEISRQQSIKLTCVPDYKASWRSQNTRFKPLVLAEGDE